MPEDSPLSEVMLLIIAIVGTTVGAVALMGVAAATFAGRHDA